MNILVTGSEGFVGRWLVPKLQQSDSHVMAIDRPTLDLEEREAVLDFFRSEHFDVVYHLAGYNGGIAFNKSYPWEIFQKNSLMAFNIVEGCLLNKARLVAMVASCAYPDSDELLTQEKFLSGQPHESIAGHGWAKRNLYLACEMARKQHDLSYACVCPATLYGPGGSTDADREKVFHSLALRLLEATVHNEPTFRLWGSADTRREFLYVNDLVDELVDIGTGDQTGLINLGGEEITIGELAELLKLLIGYQGKIVAEKLDGQKKKKLSSPDYNRTSLHDGAKKVIDYYRGILGL